MTDRGGILPNVHSWPKGKTCLVTGGAGGIGRATAAALRDLGARVIVVDLQGHAPPDGTSKITADLSSRECIDAVLSQVQSANDRVDVLVNNVGGIFPERVETVDGREMTLALNHLCSFMLTLGLIDPLKASGSALVVNVSSSHHRAGRLDFEDLEGNRKYDMNKAYCQSKLANVMFTVELARRLEGSGVTTFAVHPGATNSGFGDVLRGFWGFMWRISSPFRESPEHAGKGIASLIASQGTSENNGAYFAGGKKQDVSKRAKDIEMSRRLWSKSLELSGLHDPI